jgi:hypothetical protein
LTLRKKCITSLAFKGVSTTWWLIKHTHSKIVASSIISNLWWVSGNHQRPKQKLFAKHEAKCLVEKTDFPFLCNIAVWNDNLHKTNICTSIKFIPKVLL